MSDDAKEQIKNYYISEIESLQNQIRNVEKSKDKLITLQKEEKNRLINERNDIENMYNQSKSEKDNLDKEFNSYKNIMAKQIKEKDDKYNKDMEFKLKEISSLKDTIEKLGKEKEAFILEKNSKDNTIKEMKKNYEIVKAKKEQEQLKFVEAYNSKLQTIQNEKDDLFNKSKDLIAQIKELKAQLEMKTKELQDKSEGQSQMETLGDMLNENDLKADNEDEIALLNQEIESYKSKISNLNEKISHYESQMKNYDIFKTENESLKKNLADNKAMYEKQIADLQQTLTQKAEELKTSRRRNTTLRNSAIVQPTQQLQVLNELNEQISKLTSENKFLNKNVESMKSQIDQIKQLREKDTTFYKKEIGELTRELADSKVMQATISFEKDSQIIELRTMIKKLKKHLSKN